MLSLFSLQQYLGFKESVTSCNILAAPESQAQCKNSFCRIYRRYSHSGLNKDLTKLISSLFPQLIEGEKSLLHYEKLPSGDFYSWFPLDYVL